LFEHPCVPLADLQTFTKNLLDSGATIDELNTVRRHLSGVKGGRLVTQTQATVVSLIISDVVHDALESIASGPTAPDPTTFQDVMEVLDKYGFKGNIPGSIEDYLAQGLRGLVPETPKPRDPCFSRVHNLIVANNTGACDAAAAEAMRLGYTAVIASTSLSGEAREVGCALVRGSMPQSGGAVIAGGETTVHVTGRGRGGRNQELVLGAISELAGTSMVLASCATDGVDGSSPAAGALADGYSLERARGARLDPREALHENDAFRFFSSLGDSLLCGLTGTNVMDIQVLL
jgi:glycerate-2-kinase